ncbi:hypothetical protein AB0175_03275 [Klebsiella pneumoniae]|uniref:Uncharacterized protein n=1 Tax=Klebsiella pneumoniae TaxID=573 RepID=A0A2X3D2T0_KLEPN|nr:hypothetical protein [Klebsiella pneumoniae subsp. ozaenae]RLO16140.1 hypothetical protein D1220_09825 [Klebsiella pneumoniae]SQC19887.1 Uncharacterised protein [Klebsiella pneumoniae]HBR6620581.1 hypothetical protein [Klebsiella pneumoniae]HDH0769153.1 hypothetical protein [Klebsiella pneumoniae]
MNTSFSFRTMAIGLLLVALIVAGRLALYFHSNAVKAGEKVNQLQSDNTLQAKAIATQAFQFQRANEISNAANQYGINTDVATQGKEIEYRTILKKQPTCDLAVPASIAGGLLDYTHRLRSRAMSADTIVADTTGAGSTAAGTLTYCQAVLWIDPLLAALDKANNQLLEIRRLDGERRK